MSDIGMTVPSPAEAFPNPADADNVIYNPPPERLRELSKHLETMTEFGSAAYVTEQRSRCADETRNAIDDEFTRSDYVSIVKAFDYAQEHEMVCIDRQMGRLPEHSYCCRYYVPREYARIALALAKLFEPAPVDSSPDFLTVQLPDWNDLAIRVLPDKGVTTVLGSDYTGEAKKSFLRLFMRRAKESGGIGLHAGSKRVSIRRESGDLETVGQVFLGLSATGKSTLTAHGLRLDEPEQAAMLQDDVCALLSDGTVAGSEGNGLYIKTIDLGPDEQPALYDAATHESAVLENVSVAEDGTVDFDSDEYTSNGRTAVLREHLSSADDDIDLDSVDQVFFITRNPLMPPVAKLSPVEAAAAFMLGESIQTSAGDPSSAGESIRVVGTNPFIIGSEGFEGNRFRDLIKDLELDCFVINTGHIGQEAKNISVGDSVTILREIARGAVEWTDDESTEFTIPVSVPGMDIESFAIPDHVDEYKQKLRDLRADRRTYLAEFEELDEEIKDCIY